MINQLASLLSYSSICDSSEMEEVNNNNNNNNNKTMASNKLYSCRKWCYKWFKCNL